MARLPPSEAALLTQEANQEISACSRESCRSLESSKDVQLHLQTGRESLLPPPESTHRSTTMTPNQDCQPEEDLEDFTDYAVAELDQEHYTKSTAPATTMVTITSAPKMKIVPPLNFCPVEKKLYRSGQPSKINFEFLQELKLKTIVWLASEDPIDEFMDFVEEKKIHLFFAGINPDGGDNNPWDGLTENSIVQALNIIVDKSNYPLLVCCGMGRHRTGTVIGCLRKLQGWNQASVSEEYRRFTGSRGGRILVELLIEAFDKKTINVDPATAPDWLLRG